MMATATADSYSAVSGATVYAGVLAPPVSQRTALVGDSLTSASYGLLHPTTWINGRLGAPLQPVANLGIASQTVGDVLARIDNSYTHATQPGLSGLSPLGFVVLRIGTNSARYGGAIDGTSQGQYTSLFAKCLTYADYVIVHAIPPVGPTDGASGGIDPSWNTWLQAQCDAGGGNSRLLWCNDCITIDDGGGNWAAGYGNADGIHLNNAATYRMGVDGAASLASRMAAFGYSSPVSHDAADVYPAQPQWVSNAQMSGTGGSNSLGSGSVPTEWAISSNRSGLTVNTSIVAADGGDPNPTPWLRLTPTVVVAGTGELIMIRTTLAGAAITTSYPTQLECIFEVRFNAFDGSKFSEMDFEVRGDTTQEAIGRTMRMPMADGTINGTVIARCAEYRNMAAAAAQSSASLQWNLVVGSSFSGAMGSMDLRCLTVRG